MEIWTAKLDTHRAKCYSDSADHSAGIRVPTIAGNETMTTKAQCNPGRGRPFPRRNAGPVMAKRERPGLPWVLGVTA